MQKTSNNRTALAAVAAAVFLLAGAAMLTAFLSQDAGIAAMSFKNAGTAKFSLVVVEGRTESPIAGAKAVILETGKTYSTNENGETGVIEVPCIRDTRFDEMLPKQWGEVSLIVYKEGFLPYALFYLQVAENETRKGVKILLFENGSTGSAEPFSIIEGPNRAWVDALVKKYQPDAQ